MVRAQFAAATLIVLSGGALAAQWMNQPLPGTPRTPDGKPDLTAPAPKTADGKIDLSGIWEIVTPPEFVNSLGRFGLEHYIPDVEIPMLPWAETLFKKRYEEDMGGGRPSQSCLPHTVPDAMLHDVFKLVQTPAVLIVLFEEFNFYRQIHTDGRSHPQERNPAWFGYSIGRWEGDTLVAETVGFSMGPNEYAWLDDSGHPYTGALRTTERFRRIDFGHMELEVTIDDPQTYREPWSVQFQFRLLPDTELIEWICDNERTSLGRTNE